MRKLIPALVLVTLGLTIPSAHSASTSECLGGVPNVLGTSGNDVIRVTADEAGASATINGKTKDVGYARVVIYSKGGNDTVYFNSDGGGTALICTGDGKDTISGSMIARIHAGSGTDTVTQFIQCRISPEVFAAETVRTSYDASDDESGCN